MRFAFTADQLLFRDTVRDVLARTCTPAIVRRAWAGEPAIDVWRALVEVGVVGLTVPEEHGGLGLDELDLVLLMEEAGRAASPAPLLETTAVGAPLVRDLGGDVAARWLGSIACGEAVIAVGLESSPFVHHADGADLLLLQRGDELHAVPRADVSLRAEPSVDGARRLASVSWSPRAETRIAEGEMARSAIAMAFDRGALAAAAELVGVARRLLDTTVDYTKVRHQFGKPIGSFQAVKHHLADALLAIEFARPAVYRAAYALAKGEEARALDVSMAKARASDAALLASRVALQCHGAIGYTVEYDLHLWMKRAWALAAAWGDAAWHRARVGSFLFDRRISESRL